MKWTEQAEPGADCDTSMRNLSYATILFSMPFIEVKLSCPNKLIVTSDNRRESVRRVIIAAAALLPAPLYPIHLHLSLPPSGPSLPVLAKPECM